MGHKVRFVAVTNGDAGHHEEGGGQLAMRRRAEAIEAGRRIGVDYVVLDNHDGELVPSLDVRQQIIRQIREWKADWCWRPGPTTTIRTTATPACCCRTPPSWSPCPMW